MSLVNPTTETSNHSHARCHPSIVCFAEQYTLARIIKRLAPSPVRQQQQLTPMWLLLLLYLLVLMLVHH